jgi:hypothetical protein
MSEVQLLSAELSSLPHDERESWANWFRRELAELRAHDAWFDDQSEGDVASLKALIQEGIDSGDAGMLDADEIIREACRQRDAGR